MKRNCIFKAFFFAFCSLGPLAHLWTMRYEAKHSYFKGFASRISYKNAALSLARHHQRWMASNVVAAADHVGFFKPDVECSKKGANIPLHCLSYIFVDWVLKARENSIFLVLFSLKSIIALLKEVIFIYTHSIFQCVARFYLPKIMTKGIYVCVSWYSKPNTSRSRAHFIYYFLVK